MTIQEIMDLEIGDIITKKRTGESYIVIFLTDGRVIVQRVEIVNDKEEWSFYWKVDYMRGASEKCP